MASRGGQARIEQRAFQPEVARALRELRRGQAVADGLFDRMFPDWAAGLSRRHWTPVRVAMRAALLLQRAGARRVLDVGSGVGKFCMIGALCSAARFFGVEQRPHFVELARELSWAYGIERVTYLNRNLTELDWSHYDGFYLFNPFQEHLTPDEGLDRTIELRPWLHGEYARAVCAKLESASSGSVVATYHGFGASPPGNYERLVREPCGTGSLELWRRS